jgi:putative PIN family toxin of toxin-antitoxin system
MGALEMMRVVIDTNVLVSALLFGGTPGKLVELWKMARIQPFISREIIAELLRVLAYPKFELTQKEIEYLLYVEVLPHFEVTAIPTGSVIVKKDPSDDMFLRCAVAAEADAIITGDSHLLSLKSYKKIPILSPSQFLMNF